MLRKQNRKKIIALRKHTRESGGDKDTALRNFYKALNRKV